MSKGKQSQDAEAQVVGPDPGLDAPADLEPLAGTAAASDVGAQERGPLLGGDEPRRLPSEFEAGHLAVEALRRLRKELDRAAVVRAASDGRAVLRANAARALGVLEEPHHALVVLLRDSEPTVQEAAAAAIAEVGAKAEPLLIASVIALNALREPARSTLLRGLAELAASSEALLLATLARVPTESIEAATEILDFIGAPGVGALLRSLESPHVNLRLAAARGLRRLVFRGVRVETAQLERALNDPLDEVRNEVRRTIRDLAEATRRERFKAAIPGGLERGPLDEAALAQVARDVDQDVLLEALVDGRDRVRANAARVLGAVKTGSDLAVQRLSVLLRDSDLDVRRAAALALGQCAAHPNIAVPALLQALAAASAVEDRALLTEAVVAFGDDAVPFALAALDGHPELALRAVCAVAEADPTRYVEPLVQVVGEPRFTVRARQHAGEVLMGIGADADERIAGILATLLESLAPRPAPLPLPEPLPPRAPRVREPVAMPVEGFDSAFLDAGALAPVVKQADLAFLEGALLDGRTAMRHNAARVLGAMGKGAQPLVPALLVRVKDAEPRVAVAAIEALRQLKPAADDVAPTLAAMLVTAHRSCVAPLVSTLESFGRSGVDAILAEYCRHPTRMGAAVERAVRYLPEAFVEPVAALLRSDEGKIREKAAELLWQMGEKARKAQPALLAALDQPEGAVRATAIQALAKFGPDKKVQARLDALRTEDTRNSVRYALRCAYEAWGITIEEEPEE